MTRFTRKGEQFKDFATRLKGYQGTVIAVDPGHTTGWAVFCNRQLIAQGQYDTSNLDLAYRAARSLYSGANWKFLLPTPEAWRAATHPGPAAGLFITPGEADFNAPSSLKPDFPSGPQVVIEDYRVYSFKLDTHKFSEVFTIKVLTTFELVARFYGYPVRLTLAHLAKTFVTDQKLKDWGFWIEGERHARDAIRHASYYIVRESVGTQVPTRDFSK